MRPKKLTITAFGPYAGKTVIDMDKLGKSGIYRITGKTGVGKTTVFDAITYALYGSASGNTRQVNMLRSEYALSSTATEVEMEFEYEGKEYFIKRKPEQERAKLRGSGNTKSPADATLKYPDGSIVTGNDKVTKAVEELLGINKKQFSQIAMIAQGEFSELIKADTNSRKEIFQNIFDTKKYYELQEELKSRLSQLNARYADLKTAVNRYAKGITAGDSDIRLKQQTEDAHNGLLLPRDLPELTDKLIEADGILKGQIDEKLEKLEEETALSRNLLTQVDNLQKTIKSVENNEKELENMQEKLERLKIAFSQRQADKPRGEQLLKQAARIEARLPEYALLDEKRKRLEDTEKRIEKNNISLQQVENSCKSHSEEIEYNEKQLIQLKDVDVLHIGLENEAEKLSARQNNLDSLKKEIASFEKMTWELEQAQESYCSRAQNADEANNRYNTGSRLYFSEQAGILAQSLEQGMPCPVCGSVHHPLPAQKSANAPDKIRLDMLKEKAEAALKEVTKAAQRAAEIKARKEEKKNSVHAAEQALYGCKSDIYSLKEKILLESEEIKNNILLLQDKMAENKKNINLKTELENSLPHKKSQLAQFEAAANSIKQDIAADKALSAALRQDINKLVNKLTYDDSAKAAEAINRCIKEKENIETAFNKAESNLKNCNDAITEKTARIQREKAVIEQSLVKNVDITALKESLEKSQREKTNLLQMQKTVYTRMDRNEKARENILEKLEELKATGEKTGWVKALSDTANGTLKGKPKVMLETFVQSAYFERVASRASLRLMKMTDGQYELVSADVSSGGNKQTGLELDVIDHYNNSRRSVKSVSGGESFKVAIALALGLADEIQASAGGIKIDTMFIDEGFGSMDRDSLKLTIETMQSVARANRLIGIISHVEDIKNTISRQMIITKDGSEGRKVEIIV